MNFMEEALKQARIAFDRDEVPVGAIIVDRKTNQIIARAHNRNIELNNVTAHAEILAIKQASEFKKSQRLEGCDLYVTLEPCFMCTAAISFARIDRVYYGAREPKFGFSSCRNSIFGNNGYFKPEFYDLINEEQSRKLLQDFFLKKR